jgi:uncharacterized protein YggU (UPF0235/DUF167 family)
MAKHKYQLHTGKRGAALAIRITPQAKKDEIIEVLNNGTVLIYLKTSRDENIVNKALTDFLAKVLGVPKKKIEIVAGQTGRDKLVTILDIDAPKVQKKIVAQLS